MTRSNRHECQGDPNRFECMASFVWNRFGSGVRYIADVAGGQGLLSRHLRKNHNYECEVIDPRGWTLRGVPSQAMTFEPTMVTYYDLIIGLHPDEATRAIAEAALIRPVVIIPCCNFWSDEKLGRDELIESIGNFYEKNHVKFQKHSFPFKGPKNIGLVSEPSNLSALASATQAVGLVTMVRASENEK